MNIDFYSIKVYNIIVSLVFITFVFIILIILPRFFIKFGININKFILNNFPFLLKLRKEFFDICLGIQIISCFFLLLDLILHLFYAKIKKVYDYKKNNFFGLIIYMCYIVFLFSLLFPLKLLLSLYSEILLLLFSFQEKHVTLKDYIYMRMHYIIISLFVLISFDFYGVILIGLVWLLDSLFILFINFFSEFINFGKKFKFSVKSKSFVSERPYITKFDYLIIDQILGKQNIFTFIRLGLYNSMVKVGLSSFSISFIADQLGLIRLKNIIFFFGLNISKYDCNFYFRTFFFKHIYADFVVKISIFLSFIEKYDSFVNKKVFGISFLSKLIVYSSCDCESILKFDNYEINVKIDKNKFFYNKEYYNSQYIKYVDRHLYDCFIYYYEILEKDQELLDYLYNYGAHNIDYFDLEFLEKRLKFEKI